MQGLALPRLPRRGLACCKAPEWSGHSGQTPVQMRFEEIRIPIQVLLLCLLMKVIPPLGYYQNNVAPRAG